jgi:predicted glycosyltransferase
MSDLIGEKRIVFHAINQRGLGHLSRLSAIALALRGRTSRVLSKFIIDGSSHGLLEAAELPYFGLSIPRGKVGPGVIPQDEKGGLMRGFAEIAVEVTKPDLVVFDSFPNPWLVTAALRRKVPLALCFRKMKADKAKRIQESMGIFDVILIPHAPGEVEVPSAFARRTYFVGSIVRPLSMATSHPRAEIVITGGGGGYPGTVAFYNAALVAFADLQQSMPELSGLLVTGPLFHEWAQLRPVNGVRILHYDPDFTATAADSRLIVCQAGYNTVAEVTALGIPAVCVPAARGSDDQFERATAAASVHPQIQVCRVPDAQAMALMMRAGLAMTRRKIDETEVSRGAALAAQHLLTVLGI